MYSTVFLLHLRFIADLPHTFVCLSLWNFDFLYCNRIQKGRNCFPSKPDRPWSIYCEHLVKFTAIIQRHFCSCLFDCIHGHFSNSHSSEIVNNDPTFYLARNKHVFDNLFMNIDRGYSSWLNIFEINELGDKYHYRSEIEVPSNWIEEARLLK